MGMRGMKKSERTFHPLNTSQVDLVGELLSQLQKTSAERIKKTLKSSGPEGRNLRLNRKFPLLLLDFAA